MALGPRWSIMLCWYVCFNVIPKQHAKPAPAMQLFSVFSITEVDSESTNYFLKMRIDAKVTTSLDTKDHILNNKAVLWHSIFLLVLSSVHLPCGKGCPVFSSSIRVISHYYHPTTYIHKYNHLGKNLKVKSKTTSFSWKKNTLSPNCSHISRQLVLKSERQKAYFIGRSK